MVSKDGRLRHHWDRSHHVLLLLGGYCMVGMAVEAIC